MKVLTLCLAAVALVATAATASADTYGSADPGPVAPCDKWASPTGNNANAGSEASPYRNVAYMISRLSAGQTGCLESGSRFNEVPGEFIVPSTNGTQAQPVTIRSASAADPAEVHAQMWLKPDADNIVFRDIDFIGSPGSAKSVMLIIGGADGVAFHDNDITNTNGICFNVGALQEDRPTDEQLENSSDGFVLSGNRIHDCGRDVALTGADSGVHGVYLMHSRSPLIEGNWIYDNKNRGIQLYPAVTSALVQNNLLDGNGSNINISSEVSQHGYVSEGNTFRSNLVTNAVLRGNWDPDWPDADTSQVWGYGFGGPPRDPNEGDTHGNLVTENCIYHPDPTLNFGGWGYAQADNVFADPGYVDRAGKNFDLMPGSPCAGMGPQEPEPPEDPPGTVINSGPLPSVTDPSVSFTFSAQGAATGFECKLDGSAWAGCTSPKPYADTSEGWHLFEVRAVNGLLVDGTPATWSWETKATSACEAARAGLARAKRAVEKRKERLDAAIGKKSMKRARKALKAARATQNDAREDVAAEC